MKIACALPIQTLSNEALLAGVVGWTPDKIVRKIGIESRHIASASEDVLTLGAAATRNLFHNYNIPPSDIDYVLLCTQSPVYRLPTTACLLAKELGLSLETGALDYNLGCSGFVYGLSLAKGLVCSGSAKNVLLVTSETYTKYLAATDISTRSVFGDGAASILIDQATAKSIGAFVFGTDGSGAESLIKRDNENLKMDGPAIFSFTMNIAEKVVNTVCRRNGLCTADVDLFVFHQANAYMLNSMRRLLKIPKDRLYVNMNEVGNTVSASIPIALIKAAEEGRLKKGMKVLLFGFGVGLSWSAVILQWE